MNGVIADEVTRLYQNQAVPFGPWKVERAEDGRWAVLDLNNKLVAMCQNGQVANLIALLPDMADPDLDKNGFSVGAPKSVPGYVPGGGYT